ncbi:MAG: hypothetical protein JJE13_12875 [Thermoleophilia bacterium]|nr:hypothetical protein [Thermoleophilia bacterium]
MARHHGIKTLSRITRGTPHSGICDYGRWSLTHSLARRPHDVIIKSVKPGVREVHTFKIYVRGSARKGSKLSVRMLTFKGWSDKRVAPKVTVKRRIR